MPTQFIMGNGDREVLARLEGIETDWYRAAPDEWRVPIDWTARQFGEEDGRVLAGWPPTCQLSIPGLGAVLFCHGTPRSDTEIVTRRTSDDRLASILGDPGVSVVVCGHTHMQFHRSVGRARVVNAGSVGMPYGKPGAYWLLLGPDVELRHAPYDYTAAAEWIRGTAYPQADQFAAHAVPRPPSEETVLASFASVKLLAEPNPTPYHQSL